MILKKHPDCVSFELQVWHGGVSTTGSCTSAWAVVALDVLAPRSGEPCCGSILSIRLVFLPPSDITRKEMTTTIATIITLFDKKIVTAHSMSASRGREIGSCLFYRYTCFVPLQDARVHKSRDTPARCCVHPTNGVRLDGPELHSPAPRQRGRFSGNPVETNWCGSFAPIRLFPRTNTCA